MKNNLIIASIIAAVSMSLGSISQAADLKIGFVDMNKIFNAYYKTKDSDTRLKASQEAARADLQGRVELFNKTANEVNALNAEIAKEGISKEDKASKESERNAKFAVYQQQQQEINEFSQRRQKDLQDQTVLERNALVDDITKAVNEKVKADKYDIVFDRTGNSASGVPVVLRSPEALDFSDAIIATLNANQPKDGAATEPKKEEKKEEKK